MNREALQQAVQVTRVDLFSTKGTTQADLNLSIDDVLYLLERILADTSGWKFWVVTAIRIVRGILQAARELS